MIALEPNLVEEIADIGRKRSPAEACGVLLPEPVRGKQVWEMPNRSELPHDSFEMLGSDILIELEDWLEGITTERWHEVVIWHTHPQGNVGPSRYDMRNRLAGHHHLVIALTGKEAKPTWY